MPDILVRDIDPEKLERLKARAKRNGRSLQGEAKMLIEKAADDQKVEEILREAREWRKKLGKHSSDSAADIREDRQR